MVILAKVSSTGQIELFNHLLYLIPFNYVQIELLVLDRNTWNHLTEFKQMSSGLFKNNVTLQIIQL